jgi:hypothetical protein
MEAVDVTGLIKSLALPPGFTPPTELTYEDIRAGALSRADLAADVQGINRSLDIIRRTRGGGWPTGIGHDRRQLQSISYGTNSSFARGTHSATPSTTPTVDISGAATCTPWAGGRR